MWSHSRNTTHRTLATKWTPLLRDCIPMRLVGYYIGRKMKTEKPQNETTDKTENWCFFNGTQIGESCDMAKNQKKNKRI